MFIYAQLETYYACHKGRDDFANKEIEIQLELESSIHNYWNKYEASVIDFPTGLYSISCTSFIDFPTYPLFTTCSLVSHICIPLCILFKAKIRKYFSQLSTTLTEMNNINKYIKNEVKEKQTNNCKTKSLSKYSKHKRKSS